MISIIFLIIFGLLSTDQDADSLELRRVEGDGYVELIFVNKNIYPVTVELDLDVQNLKSERKLPLNDVIKGKSQKNVVRLDIENPRVPYGMKTQYKWYQGNIFAIHDDRTLYKFPFKRGASFRLDQGYNGSFSHNIDATRYSLDFYMPEGTPIHSARDGIVIDVIDGNNVGGAKPEYRSMANNITIMHADGTMADYSHLKFRGSKVKLGQRVRAGQLIGYSGSTGYATGPHLHFTVKKAKKGGGFVSIPVKFTSQKGIIDVLVEGEEYMAY